MVSAWDAIVVCFVEVLVLGGPLVCGELCGGGCCAWWEDKRLRGKNCVGISIRNDAPGGPSLFPFSPGGRVEISIGI